MHYLMGIIEHFDNLSGQPISLLMRHSLFYLVRTLIITLIDKTLLNQNPLAFIIAPTDRESFVTVQTPQIFNMTPLKDSMSKLSKSSESLTDESQALERYGYKTYAVDGDHENIKITYSSDLIPPFLLNGRLGRGIDFHKVIPGNGITLGGVFIKCNLILKFII